MSEEVKTEVNLRHCRECGVLKKRILVGKFPDGKNNRYLDENNKLWNGLKCADCQSEHAKKKMKELRFRQAIAKNVEVPGVE